MDSFIERFCAKYYFPYAEGRQLIEGMEYKTYRKGDCLVREGERDTSFYIIARGIWRGHYLRDGQEVSVWFASEGEALFSTWGYVDNAVSRITIEAMSEAALYCMPKQKLEKLFASSVDFANLGRKLFEPQTIISVNQKEYKDNKLAFSIRRIVLKKTSASFRKHFMMFFHSLPKNLNELYSFIVSLQSIKTRHTDYEKTSNIRS